MITRKPSHDEIAQRAFELYQKRGCLPGHESEDWLEAEKQLSAEPGPGKGDASRTSHSGHGPRKKKPARLSTAELEEGTNPWEHALPRRRPNAARSL